MTKICPNFKTENSDIAGFYQKCGNEIQDPVKAPRVQQIMEDSVHGGDD
jgi:hypothetical protein